MPDRHGHRDPADLGGLTDGLTHGPADGPADGVDVALAAAYRRERPQVLATVVRLTRDLDAAQDAVQEAFAAALTAWRVDGVPANPGAWLTATARRKAVDARRRAERRRPLLIVPEPTSGYGFPSDLLRLVFTCCHPALDPAARIALTLNVVCGLPTADVARLFLVPAATMAARVTRAKRKLRTAGIPYRVPGPDELADRLPAVLTVGYLFYAQGHTPGRGSALTAADVAERAIDLARMLADQLPDEPEVIGLLALLLLTDARRPARLDGAGVPVLLADQDRTRWDRALVDEGMALVPRARGGGPYAIQAAIAAVHAAAPTAADTDWPTILGLYDVLLRVHPSPVAALARCMAYAEVAGPAAGLAALETVAADARLAGYHLVPAARGDLLRRLGRDAEAAVAYRAAAAQAGNAVEREYLLSRSGGMEVARTGAEQPWDPEDLAVAEGHDPTPAAVERARRELGDDGPAAIERTVP